MSIRGARLNSSSNLSPPSLDVDSEQTFEEIFKLLDVTIKNLLKKSDYTSSEVFRDLKLIQKQSRYSEDVLLHHHVVDKIVRSGIGHVFLRSWHQLSSRNYFGDVESGNVSEENISDTNPRIQFPSGNGGSAAEDQDELDGVDDRESEERNGDSTFLNLQYVLSVIWNCTDSSVQLCESLVRSSVIYEMLLQLSQPILVDSKYYSMEESNSPGSPAYKRVYLMKAYLGILHNIARHCPESRKMFRSAGALRHLRALVRFPQEVVRAKTYLTLSYIVSGDDEDSNILEAADDIASFIVAILREALGSVNHFVVRYAFWASEIACGINHLAIIDANKVRLGRLGVIQLYASMLLDGDDEEKSLASSGIWILSFHQENKRVIRSDPALIKTLTQVASRCTLESVSRSLRGALWVARSNPGSLLEDDENGCYGDDDDDDPSQEHIMISYHWSCQKTMIRVRDALYARGYKVWFDVDNMRGSTLEAMALAVERSAVILICMSQSYKESPNCRTEAEYAFKMRKDIIPIVAQHRFMPNGWLGMLAGTKLYFDFSPAALQEEMSNSLTSDTSADEVGTNQELFNLQMERLAREIGQRGKKKKTSQTNCFQAEAEVVGKPHSSGNNDLGDVGSDGDGGSVKEDFIAKVQHQTQQQQPRGLLNSQPGLGKIRMDSGISSAEVASSIINQMSPRCHKCGAVVGDVGGPFHKFPMLSISSSTPEFEEPNIPKLLPSPTPLHTYRQESMSSSPKFEVKSWSSEQVVTWMRSHGLDNHTHLFSNFTGHDLLAYRRVMRTAPEFFYQSLKDLNLKLVEVLRFSEALEGI